MKKNTSRASVSESKYTIAIAQEFVSTATGKKLKLKPTMLDFDTIRRIGKSNPLIQVLISTLKHTVTKIPFHVVTKNDKDIKQYADLIANLEHLFKKPNDTIVGNHRGFWNQILDDVLLIDRGAVELVRNSKGEIVQMFPTDGATIKPSYDIYGQLLSPAYFQVVQGMETDPVPLNEEDIKLIINNPSPEIGMTGFGVSPVEKIITSVITSIQIENFNGNQFNRNTLPPYWLNLPNAPDGVVKKIQQAWENNNSQDLWKAIFTNVPEGAKLEKLRPSNQEMQFFEQSQWLAKIIIAAFEMSPQDIGLTMDINKSTGEVQQNLSKNQGVKSMLALMSEFYEAILEDFGQYDSRYLDLEFVFDELDVVDDKKQADVDMINWTMGVDTTDELRIRRGKQALTEEEKAVATIAPDKKEILKSKYYGFYQ